LSLAKNNFFFFSQANIPTIPATIFQNSNGLSSVIRVPNDGLMNYSEVIRENRKNPGFRQQSEKLPTYTEVIKEEIEKK